MESIKHKMDTMVKEKDAAIEKAMGFEAETEELNKVCCFLQVMHVFKSFTIRKLRMKNCSRQSFKNFLF